MVSCSARSCIHHAIATLLFFVLCIAVSKSDALSRHNSESTSRNCTISSGSCAVPERTTAQPLLCIVVPFRDGCGLHSQDRSHQLEDIIDYLNRWLTARGHLDFLFIVSEQSQSGLFNKGLMMNLGSLAAFEAGCQHLVFHDVDQYPENPLNDYFYRGNPTHLCTWSTQFALLDAATRENAKMRPHVGGALLMSRDDYVAVNGFSNVYWRWGLEDNDMYHRIHAVFGNLTRLPQVVGTHTHAHVHTHTHRETHKHTNTNTYGAHTHVHLHTELQTCTHTHTCTYTHKHAQHTHANTHKHAQTFSFSCTHTDTHTHMHT